MKTIWKRFMRTWICLKREKNHFPAKTNTCGRSQLSHKHPHAFHPPNSKVSKCRIVVLKKFAMLPGFMPPYHLRIAILNLRLFLWLFMPLTRVSSSCSCTFFGSFGIPWPLTLLNFPLVFLYLEFNLSLQSFHFLIFSRFFSSSSYASDNRAFNL